VDTELRGVDAKGSWEWLRFASQLPAKPFQFTALTAGKLIYSGRCILREITGLNNGASGGTLTLLDGQDNTGVLAGTQGYAASAQFSHSFATFGILLELGCFLNPGTQSITGTVALVPLWEYNITPPGE